MGKKQMTVSEMAREGGKARAKNLTAQQRKEIARKAGKASGVVRAANAKR